MEIDSRTPAMMRPNPPKIAHSPLVFPLLAQLLGPDEGRHHDPGDHAGQPQEGSTRTRSPAGLLPSPSGAFAAVSRIARTPLGDRFADLEQAHVPDRVEVHRRAAGVGGRYRHGRSGPVPAVEDLHVARVEQQAYLSDVPVVHCRIWVEVRTGRLMPAHR